MLLVFYMYYNLIFVNGVDVYVKVVKVVGVDGIFMFDLLLEEVGEVVVVCVKYGVKMVFIVVLMMLEVCMEIIGKVVMGFIYYVLCEGVIGVWNEVVLNVFEVVVKIKVYMVLLVVVGFGILKCEYVKEIVVYVDGVVVGSVLVNCICDNLM